MNVQESKSAKAAGYEAPLKAASAASEPLLQVRGLKKYYPVKQGMFGWRSGQVKAVDGLDFVVMPGETLGIVGESGCGKSTMGQMVTCLLEPTEGEVRFQGKSLFSLGAEELRRTRRHLQMVFQDPYSSLNPRMRIFDIIAEPLQVHQIARGSKLREEVHRLLDIVGLGAHLADRYPHEFSGGQRQRVGIARALALNPKLIVCDEPISALDVSIQAQILNLLKDLQQQFDLTYIFIAHGLPSIKHISDRIAVMYLGKIVELATRDELFTRTKHPYTEALLAAVPIPDPLLRRERTPLSGELPNPANPPRGCAFHPRCPYATELCQSNAPALLEVAPGHLAACHYPLEKSDHLE
jgi:oligopeptide/dipeptide ABC transporter ATP-binding protein